MSFDPIIIKIIKAVIASQSLWNRAVSFDALVVSVRYNYNRLNPFGTGQCLSTEKCFIHLYHNQYVSIPLEQGSVFRRTTCIASGRVWAVSIPLEQGSVFRQRDLELPEKTLTCLNPFGTGQCLSTYKRAGNLKRLLVSIPLEQGSVFRHKWNIYGVRRGIVSIPLEQGSVFRQVKKVDNVPVGMSQSLWNRAVSFDCSGVLKPCGTRLARATFQLFPRLRELGLDLIKYCTIFNILFTYQAVENGRDFTRVFRFY